MSELATGPDGTWLVTGSVDGSATIWAFDGTPRVTITAGRSPDAQR